MRSLLRRIWPQCDLHFTNGSLTTTGGVIDLQSPCRSRAKYIEDATNARWQTRQNTLRARQVSDRQQEYLLFTIIQHLGRLEKPLFWQKPSASISAVQALVRVCAWPALRPVAHGHLPHHHAAGRASALPRFAGCSGAQELR